MPEIAVGDINLIPAEEYQNIIYDFNDTAVDYPQDTCVHDLFSEQAKKTPDKVALVFEDKEFTYRKLDEMSNSLAHYLLMRGVRKGEVVGVLLGRSERIIVAQLAVLKIGAVFLPIDSRYPKDRVNYLINDCNIDTILTDSEQSYDHTSLTVINLNHIDYIDKSPALVECNLEDPCYIIYTSGSTGNPKGCVLKQRGIVNFCRNNNILSNCNNLKKQIVVSVNTISFDYFIAESLLPLVNGYTVILANENQSSVKRDFRELVMSKGVNIIMTTPTRYNIYIENEVKGSYFEQIDIIVTSGEPLTNELLYRIHQISGAKIFNPLGPSECSIWNTSGDFT